MTAKRKASAFICVHLRFQSLSPDHSHLTTSRQFERRAKPGGAGGVERYDIETAGRVPSEAGKELLRGRGDAPALV
ncbi:MAG TPA: hypothetical protein VMG61_16805, partial [Usitatibacter sp.]|nr:hypothetical protein [Usitatibacter sp.]